jgi:hypothetical protein
MMELSHSFMRKKRRREKSFPNHPVGKINKTSKKRTNKTLMKFTMIAVRTTMTD